MLIRVIKDTSNRDGWIGRTLDTNRVCFFLNLSDHIISLESGQVWEAKIIDSKPTADLINLHSQVH